MTRQELNHQLAQYRHTVRSGSGIVTLDGGIKCYAPSVKFYGACTQDGTPTPETPVPVKCNNAVWTMNGVGGTVDLSLLPDGGLYGIGDVRDEWDAETGKGVRRFIKRKIKDISWSRVTGYGAHAFFYSNLATEKALNAHLFSDSYSIYRLSNATLATFGNYAESYQLGNGATNNRLYLRDDRFSSVDTLKNAMGEVEIVFEMLNPLEFTAPTQPIIEQSGFNQLLQSNGDIANTDAEVRFVVHS